MDGGAYAPEYNMYSEERWGELARVALTEPRPEHRLQGQTPLAQPHNYRSQVLQSARVAFQEADCVAFDVDSTVITTEGLDELAQWIGAPGIEDITRATMAGKIPFQESFKNRLDMLQPTRQMLEDFATDRPPTLSPHVAALIKKLHERGTRVYLVSGGLSELIAPVAARLDIPKERIFSNQLYFTSSGQYAGVDFSRPTSRAGGKAKVLQSLDCDAPVMIGDGATDLEARGKSAAFIGYGGNVIHRSVQEKADWFITDFSELLAALA